MQEGCISRLKTGVSWDAMHMLAHEIAVDGLLDLGILCGGRSALLASQVSLAFFPHGLGHFIGLDVHDVGGNPDRGDGDAVFRYLRTRGVLPAGSEVTVDPGVCIFTGKVYAADSL
jgi:Xaa-Pro dipeptidase